MQQHDFLEEALSVSEGLCLIALSVSNPLSAHSGILGVKGGQVTVNPHNTCCFWIL